MKLSFEKYHGAGNDFIMLDGWNHVPEISHQQIRLLCDRHFGIGADGLMILKRHDQFDFEMLYYNADGAPGSMCGNGGRCISRFAMEKKYVGEKIEFLASDGPHTALMLPDNYIGLRMNDVSEVEIKGVDMFIDTGSPHYIRVVENVSELDVFAEGRKVRFNEEYKAQGTNVNFVMPYADGYFVRTYERGVEAETLSCGTGVTAVALSTAYRDNSKGNNNIKIFTTGGELRVRFHFDGTKFEDVWLEGPAERVFQGVIEI